MSVGSLKKHLQTRIVPWIKIYCFCHYYEIKSKTYTVFFCFFIFFKEIIQCLRDQTSSLKENTTLHSKCMHACQSLPISLKHCESYKHPYQLWWCHIGVPADYECLGFVTVGLCEDKQQPVGLHVAHRVLGQDGHVVHSSTASDKNKDFIIIIYYYSQTCVKQPHKGSTKSGCLRQVAA